VDLLRTVFGPPDLIGDFAMLFRTVSIATLFVVLAGWASADEKVSNPDFKSWSKFAKGTSVTRTGKTTLPNGQISVLTETTTLKEVGADKVVVEVEYISDVPGSTKFKTRPESKEILKLVPLPAGVKEVDFTSRLPGTVEEGKKTEKVKVPAGEFQCKRYRTKVEARGSRIDATVWVSEEVPGRIVRVVETRASKEITYTTVRELTEFKKP
jgi:hypothetical protein